MIVINLILTSQDCSLVFKSFFITETPLLDAAVQKPVSDMTLNCKEHFHFDICAQTYFHGQ